MKKILKNLPLLALVLTFAFVGCTSDQETTNTDDATAKSKIPVLGDDWIEIGYIKNDMPTMTFDTKKALQTLSTNMAKHASVNETYTSVYVTSIDNTYNLVFEGDTYRTSYYVKIIQSNGKLGAATAANVMVANRRITCTTSDCSHEPTGCAVKYDNDDTGLPYCSPCANGGKCTKTDLSAAEAVAVASGVF